MGMQLHRCAADGCDQSILVTTREEIPFAAVATVLASEGWSIRQGLDPKGSTRAICPRHREGDAL